MNEPRTLTAKSTLGIGPVLALILLTGVVYWPAGRCEFVNYDDPVYVDHNEHVRSGLSIENAIWAFYSHENANWHPLTWLSLQLDASLYGMKPAAFHVTNVAMHCVNVALLFWMMVRMTGRTVPSWCAAALWAVHPLHVQSVVWVTERKDVLSTLFFLLAIVSYVRYCEWRTWPRYGVVMLSLGLSLLAKPMAVTLPCVLLLLDAWPLKRMSGVGSVGRVVREKLPLFLLVGGYAVAIFLVHRASGGVGSAESYPLAERLANAAVAYVTYLREYFWPSPLVVLAPYVRRTWAEPAVWLALGLVGAITVTAVRLRRQRPYALVGWLWYLGTLVPVIGIVHIGEHAHADRYTYIPLMGIDVALSWWIVDLVAVRSRFVRTTVAASAVVAMAILVLLTRQQIEVWRTSESLWTHVLEHDAGSATAWCALGHSQQDVGEYEKAAESYRKALSLNPQFLLARANLICTLVAADRLDEADEEYLRLGVESSLDVEQHYQLGVKADEGGRDALAIGAFAHVIRLQPENGRAHLRTALLLLKRDCFEAAVRHFEVVERVAPSLLDLAGVREEYARARKAAEQTKRS